MQRAETSAAAPDAEATGAAVATGAHEATDNGQAGEAPGVADAVDPPNLTASGEPVEAAGAGTAATVAPATPDGDPPASEGPEGPAASAVPAVRWIPAARAATAAPAAPAAPEAPDAPDTRRRPGWRYTEHGGESRRDLRLDFLRGFAVFAMVVDHLGGASWLYALTGGNRFLVSAAEGFVFISGVVVGIVYGARVRADGLRATTPRLLQRAWTLYALAVWLAIGTAFVAAVCRLPGGAALAEAPTRFVFEVVTLQRTHYLVDVMLLYCFLMLLAPLALALLLRRAWWLLALASWGLWAAYQFSPRALQLPWPIEANPVFKLASWQVLFFTGMILGYERDRLGRTVGRLRSPLRDGWLVPLGGALGLLIWLHATNGAALAPYVPGGTVEATAALLDAWFEKSALPPARLLACALVFAFAWALATRCWLPLRRAAGWFLLPLGQGALYAYAAHLFLIPAVHLAVLAAYGAGEDGGYPPLHPGVNAALQVAGLLILWGLTCARFLGSVVAPLGASPLVRWRLQPGGPGLWRPGDALALVLIVAFVSGTLLATGGTGQGITASWSLLPTTAPGEGPAATATAQAGGRRGPQGPAGARDVSTVIAPRKVAGPARGSSGQLAAIATATATATAGQAAPPPQPAPAPQPTPTPEPSGSALGAAPPRPGDPRNATPGAGSGHLRDGEFYSRALGRTMPYGIYLPPGYDAGIRTYPVLYMLHGGGGHYSEWVEYGLPEIADRLIQQGRIPQLIIVMPQGDRSYWVNHAGADAERWGDYLADDLVAHVDATYRTIAEPAGRAIGGLSMGGFGALSLAFTHPDVFGVVGAHSPVLRFWEDSPEFLGDEEHYAAIDPVERARTLVPARAPRIWLDVGEEDRWSERVVALHQILAARGVVHEYQLTPGDHDAAYWSGRVRDYLRFYTSSFLRFAGPGE